MTRITRSINRVLGRTVGVQVVPSSTRSVRLSTGWFRQLVYFDDLLRCLHDVSGDIVECGVAGGVSLAMLSSIARAQDLLDGRLVWGFDAWSGLPAPGQEDLANAASIATAGMFGYTSARCVKDELGAYGWSNAEISGTIRLVRGHFDETLPSFDRDIAFLHIDADLYESYRSALLNLWPRVQIGGIVAFDEYEETAKWPGARRAVNEFRQTPEGRCTDLRHDVRSGKWWMIKQTSA
jgi:Macrocin-O-methyltransferase (TylF)